MAEMDSPVEDNIDADEASSKSRAYRKGTRNGPATIQVLESEGSAYLEFLNRQRSKESEEELERFSVTLRGYRIIIGSAIRKLTLRIQDVQLEENISMKSSGRLSTRSNASSYATRKHAKAEAFKSLNQICEMETSLKKKQAELKLRQAITEKETSDIDAEMSLLNLKKEA
ncbi:unnamed protein product [Mytilus coruscus]|uniref:Uncharacterized protein n=1 Tax=Mytilus coruscus TaxID=42192 RepID=A0A6J8A9Y6_MYTCO|nr:unnamed protein product [Mytilus coruscus]